ncbi:MAG: CAP domain-containing protein [Pseudomonadota bacterium]|uniref:CAP domain-containing protein n=1 Tax=Sphingomonas sp. ERG5 TaxID=1381597 RepID=UPI00054BFD49|nr:CAP domain-containing protein [Sphingomonas sp. ERG5]
MRVLARGLLSIGLLLAGCSNGPARVTEERTFSGVAPRGDALLRKAMLAGHNDARARTGAAPLAWNATLAADARGYAQDMARSRRFEHSHEPRGASAQGENLWTGTRGAYRYDEMIGHWVEEQRFYRRAPTPYFSTSGKWQDVAHYTQIIWGRTTEFGCATASNDQDDYLVCRYTPPGNVVGQLP